MFIRTNVCLIIILELEAFFNFTCKLHGLLALSFTLNIFKQNEAILSYYLGLTHPVGCTSQTILFSFWLGLTPLIFCVWQVWVWHPASRICCHDIVWRRCETAPLVALPGLDRPQDQGSGEEDKGTLKSTSFSLATRVGPPILLPWQVGLLKLLWHVISLRPLSALDCGRGWTED